MRKSLVIAVVFTAVTPTRPLLAAPPCAEHGGIARCDVLAGRPMCDDGTLDRRRRCEVPPPAPAKAKPEKPTVKTLSLPSHTDRGQITLPGETPPPTTLENQ